MGFKDDVNRFGDKAARRIRAVHHEAVFTAHRSITLGSPLTGAPGQPVDTGRLRNSWQISILSPGNARIATRVKYARSIEDGVSYAHGGVKLTLRSQVGGFHSLKMTVANWDRIVRDANRRVSASPAFGSGPDSSPGVSVG